MVLAASILAIGVAFLLWTLRPSAAPSLALRTATTDAPILALADLAARPANEARHALAERVQATDIEGAESGDLTRSQVAALADAAAERLSLLIEPDYDRFNNYCKRLTGREAPLGREEWMSGSSFFKGIPTDPAKARVVLRAFNGHIIQEPRGRFITNTPAKGYGRLSDPGAQRFTAIDVYVPVEGADVRSTKSLRLYYLMRFGWDAQRSSWQPLQQGLYDPENRDAALLPPPI